MKYVLRVIDVFTKYAYLQTLKDKKGKSALNAFVKIVNQNKCKPNYGFIKEDNFIIKLYKNGSAIMIF